MARDVMRATSKVGDGMEALPATRRERQPTELLGDIPRRVRLPPYVAPADALGAVLCALTQHVSGAETRHLLDALPPACRPPLERCARHRDAKASTFGREEMLRRIALHLDVSLGDAEDITAAVMMAIGLRVRAEALHELAGRLPRDLRELWVVRRVASPAEPHPVFEEVERHVMLPYGLTGMGAFTAVMSLLSRRFSRTDARYLADSLPLDLRPLLAGSRADRAEEPESFGREELLARVAVHLDVRDAVPVVRAVFRAVQPYLRADVSARVTSQLPRDLQELWVMP
jgi:uncharacterized protein (DUF2267 family)